VQTGETVFNERWAEMLGYTLAELSPVSLETWIRLSHPEDLARARRELERHFAGELGHYECEMRMRHRDGHWVWILDRGRIKTRTSDGLPHLMFGTHTDVSSAHRSAEEAHESAQMLAGLARIQREFLIEPEPRRSFDRMLEFLLEISRSTSGFIGEVHSGADGAPFLKTHAITDSVWDEPSRELFESDVAQAPGSTHLRSLFEAVLTARVAVLSNSRVAASRVAAPSSAPAALESFLGLPLFIGEDLVGMVGLANRPGGFDARLLERLEPLVATCSTMVRSIRLARQREQEQAQRRELETRLAQAQRLESLGLLAGGIAHDFNNLLTGILGRCELASAELAPHSAEREHVERATEGAERAAELVHQLLVYAGKAPREPSRVDLSELAGEMRRLLEVSLPRRCTLVFELGRALLPVHADASQLRQLLMNLVLNAGEAMGERGGRVLVATGQRLWKAAELREFDPACELLAGTYIHVDVEDEGCGMDAATRARIFEPFFTTKFTGRGLGLSAALGIVRSHGGAVQCTSELGRGTRFRIILPAANASALPTPTPRESREEGDDWTSDATVLVVDDEAAVAYVASQFLRELGCRVLVATDGRTALELHDRHAAELDLVVLDQVMPDLGGEEVLAELRRRGSTVRVLLTSGFRDATTPAPTTPGDVAGFLPKPYTRATFRALLRKALDSRIVR
jgi:PAS domain S-box-containing protein